MKKAMLFLMLFLMLFVIPSVILAGNNGVITNIITPNVVEPGATFAATFLSTNTGTTTWFLGIHNIGSQKPQDNTFWGSGRVFLPYDVKPGKTVTVVAMFTAPNVFGSHSFAWKMVHDGVEWFGTEKSVDIMIEGQTTLPGIRIDLKDRQSAVIFNTGPYVTDGISRTRNWKNQTGKTIIIRAAYLWTGVDLGGVFDSHVQVTRSDGSYVHILQWDHYKDPTAPQHGVWRYFEPGYMALNPGEELILSYFSSPGGGKHAHHVFIMDYNFE